MADLVDVVIVGGGVIGASVAWNLAVQGCRNVVVLEREPRSPVHSSARGTGGARAQFASELNIELSKYSLNILRRFEDVVGYPSSFQANGYLFCATTAAHVTYLDETRALQERCGVGNVERLGPSEIARMVPCMNSKGFIAANYCGTDGLIDPPSITQGFLRRAADYGVDIRYHTTVTGFERDGLGLTVLHTTRGAIATRTCVLAAGAFTAPLGRMMGIELPVSGLRRMLVATPDCDVVPRGTPMTIDMSDGFHFRPKAGYAILAWDDSGGEAVRHDAFDEDFPRRVHQRAVKRLPGLAAMEASELRGWAGLYEMTPDHFPLLGPVREVRGVYVAAGFSGHGIMHSPAAGRIIADQILQGETSIVEARLLRPERFDEGEPLHEPGAL